MYIPYSSDTKLIRRMNKRKIIPENSPSISLFTSWKTTFTTYWDSNFHVYVMSALTVNSIHNSTPPLPHTIHDEENWYFKVSCLIHLRVPRVLSQDGWLLVLFRTTTTLLLWIRRLFYWRKKSSKEVLVSEGNFHFPYIQKWLWIFNSLFLR